ncbi:MAG TPA: hypothetical protein VGH40_11455 [Roseiarcus sp.]|jgi:uncharacterized membrane-anchored protein
MRKLPAIDAGYWVAIVAASMCGTNAGDLAAGPLGLGHIRGILPIGAIFLGIIWAEKALSWTTVAFYWLAIILLRTMATNVADLAAHELKLPHIAFLLLLVAFMAAMLWADQLRRERAPASDQGRPDALATHWSYWVLMLAAGVLGTALGDWLAEDVGLGVYWSSMIGFPFFACAVWAAYRFGLGKPWYWLAIVTCRTWGTDLGDMVVVMFRSVASKPAALWISTALTGALLAGVIALWTFRNRAVEVEAAPEAG